MGKKHVAGSSDSVYQGERNQPSHHAVERVLGERQPDYRQTIHIGIKSPADISNVYPFHQLLILASKSRSVEVRTGYIDECQTATVNTLSIEPHRGCAHRAGTVIEDL